MNINVKALISQFNQPDTILVVSGWPAKDKDGERNHGMAWYTRRTVEQLARKYGRKVVVLAENGMGERIERYYRGRVLVLRVFGKGRPSIYPVILHWLSKFSLVRKVYVHSEFGATGGIKHFVMLPLFLSLIRLSGRKIIYFSHNVISGVEQLGGHLNLPKLKPLLWGCNKLLGVYYKAVAALVEKMVVLEESLGKRLSQFVSEDKVLLVPLSIERKQKVKAKKHKDELVLLYFGFISWYKGADWLVSVFDKVSKLKEYSKVCLIMAGGEAYSLRERKYYQQFYEGVKGVAEKNDRIELTGFVKENNIGRYMSMADVVVLPYRGLMGASGTLNLALSYGKPVLVSNKMKGAFSAKEMRGVLKECGLKKSDIEFGLSKGSFIKKLKLLKRKGYLKALERFSRKYAQLRSKDRLFEREYESLYQQRGKGYDVVEDKGKVYAKNWQVA